MVRSATGCAEVALTAVNARAAQQVALLTADRTGRSVTAPPEPPPPLWLTATGCAEGPIGALPATGCAEDKA